MRFPSLERTLGRSAAALAGASALASAAPACITAPPPDLPEAPVHRPTIMHDAVVPTASGILTVWPMYDTFVVPIEVYTPSLGVEWEAYVDYYTGPDNRNRSATPAAGSGPVFEDGGAYVALVTVPLDEIAKQQCHMIQVVVSSGFEVGSTAHTPDSQLGDTIDWNYQPGGQSCYRSDASKLLDASAVDAPVDGLPIVPD
jgi:hypothetical protein